MQICKFEVQDNGVAVLTLNNPERLNPLDLKMRSDLVEACKIVQEEDSIKVLVITGAGRGFSSGGDINGLLAAEDVAAVKRRIDTATSALRTVYDLEKPVIAAVNGPVAGASLSLMMACDLVVAAESAVFGFTFINIALCPDCGTSHFLARKVGYHKAAEMVFFGRILKAPEALEIGLVNKLVPTEDTVPAALEWADQLARKPLFTILMDKKLLKQALINDYYQQASIESMYQLLAWSSQDFKEGAQAFLEKRKPQFVGK
ncbi:MAG: enoyl-CoA hydratase/isomerase family protein [Syntrophomonadaceae bacterium]|jgi:2-(1,2-epoxy-1,2-dihydrophenyl)acetyl-CoA isomerase